MTVLARAIFRTQSKVYGGAFLQKWLTTFSYVAEYLLRTVCELKKVGGILAKHAPKKIKNYSNQMPRKRLLLWVKGVHKQKMLTL